MKVPFTDLILFSQAHRNNKLMSYHFSLCSLTRFALLDTEDNQSFVNTCFARLSKLSLSPFCVLRIKVEDRSMILVHQETLPFNITMVTLNSLPQEPMSEIEGF